MRADSFDRLAILLHQRSGHSLGRDKMYLVEARLRPIVTRSGVGDLDRLVERIGAEPWGSLSAEVVEAMTTNETLFFRDHHPFADLADHQFARLAAGRKPGDKLRVWSAASSFGQEAYSIAMVAAEQRWTLGDRRVEILGTDIAEAALARARLATYSEFEVQRGLSPARCAQHFQRRGAEWQVCDTLRAMVEFRRHNLLEDPRGLGKFDIIFCRNVLIYFDQPTKSRVLASVARQLAPDGVLYLGGSETLLGLEVGLRRLEGTHTGYGLDAARAPVMLTPAL